ncbi:probable conjugal transfer protein [Rhizobium etli CFN 42]|uniref:Probable conjugal transfer protein n=1 Tax=Rhizobium etli (strain ATCC 51251 / DSM 11541 / JCM 21823 / NBRC 15573 / CFN 42) TaxID=347834 RepID=Q2K8T1_RHIEC|nr:MobA/MobL family protein [Rhizobium etli]ABC90755.1 probable conjugal transfer protein [Rhizobium etli CFN 42]
MAIYHLHVKNISRGEGRSILAAAAYRAGETLPNEIEERMSVFGGRRDVVANEIRLPQGAPSWMADRAELWNAVEAAEIRKDARLAKELEFSLPRELPRSAWLGVAHAMADAYTAKGFVADLAIHDDGAQHNPHVHLLLTTRVITEKGFGPKIRSADGRAFVIEARSLWARVANAALGKAGIAVAIDERSYAKRQLERKPGEHRGPDREERQARRARLQQRRPQMIPRDNDDNLPVPDPDGSPIHPRELAKAESRMLDDMHGNAPPGAISREGDIAAARAVIDRQNTREMSEDQAAAYRLASEDMLDWLGEKTLSQDVADLDTLERWENHLDWLEPEQRLPAAPGDDGISREPDRGRS